VLRAGAGHSKEECAVVAGCADRSALKRSASKHCQSRPKHLENLDQLPVTARSDLLDEAILVLLHQSIPKRNLRPTSGAKRTLSFIQRRISLLFVCSSYPKLAHDRLDRTALWCFPPPTLVGSSAPIGSNKTSKCGIDWDLCAPGLSCRFASERELTASDGHHQRMSVSMG
jgi:hypothetical protein